MNLRLVTSYMIVFADEAHFGRIISVEMFEGMRWRDFRHAPADTRRDEIERGLCDVCGSETALWIQVFLTTLACRVMMTAASAASVTAE